MESIVSISTSVVLALIIVKQIWNALISREITHVRGSVNKGWKDLQRKNVSILTSALQIYTTVPLNLVASTIIKALTAQRNACSMEI